MSKLQQLQSIPWARNNLQETIYLSCTFVWLQPAMVVIICLFLLKTCKSTVKIKNLCRGGRSRALIHLYAGWWIRWHSAKFLNCALSDNWDRFVVRGDRPGDCVLWQFSVDPSAVWIVFFAVGRALVSNQPWLPQLSCPRTSLRRRTKPAPTSWRKFFMVSALGFSVGHFGRFIIWMSAARRKNSMRDWRQEKSRWTQSKRDNCLEVVYFVLILLRSRVSRIWLCPFLLYAASYHGKSLVSSV